MTLTLLYHDFMVTFKRKNMYGEKGLTNNPGYL